MRGVNIIDRIRIKLDSIIEITDISIIKWEFIKNIGTW
jgi:hypothetical protein